MIHLPCCSACQRLGGFPQVNLVFLTIPGAKRRAACSRRELATKKALATLNKTQNSRNRSQRMFTYTRGQNLQPGLVAHAGNPSTQGAGGLCVSGSSGKPCLKSTRSHRLERWLGGSECLLLHHKDQSSDSSGHVGWFLWFVITWTLFCPLQGMFLELSGHVWLL